MIIQLHIYILTYQQYYYSTTSTYQEYIIPIHWAHTQARTQRQLFMVVFDWFCKIQSQSKTFFCCFISIASTSINAYSSQVCMTSNRSMTCMGWDRWQSLLYTLVISFCSLQLVTCAAYPLQAFQLRVSCSIGPQSLSDNPLAKT